MRSYQTEASRPVLKYKLHTRGTDKAEKLEKLTLHLSIELNDLTASSHILIAGVVL